MIELQDYCYRCNAKNSLKIKGKYIICTKCKCTEKLHPTEYKKGMKGILGDDRAVVYLPNGLYCPVCGCNIVGSIHLEETHCEGCLYPYHNWDEFEGKITADEVPGEDLFDWE